MLESLSPAPRVLRDRRYSGKAWRRARDATLARDGYTCQACGRQGRRGDRWLVADHRVPPHRYPGPFADVENLWCLCKECNNSKGDATVEEWRARAEPGRPETSYRHPYVVGASSKPSPLIVSPELPRLSYAYHVHRWGDREWQVTLVGDMGRSWPQDGTCPPDCTAYRREGVRP